MPVSKALRVGKFTVTSNDIAPGAVTFTALGNIYSSNIIEHTNLFFTNVRVRNNVSATIGVAGYDSGTGVFSIPSTTSHLTEGANLYFSNARVADAFVGTGTANALLYLNGSKVATTSSALTFDGTRIRAGGTIVSNNYYVQTNGGVQANTSMVAQGTLQSYSGAGVFMSYESTYGRIESYDYTGATYKNLAIAPNGGNVGVGTTSPGSKLTVSGDVQILSTNYLSFSNTAQQTYIRASATSTLAFGTNSTQAMTLDASGNLGVGTTVAPGANGGGIAIYKSDYPRLTFRNSTSGDTTSDGLQIALVGNDVTYDLAESGYQRWTTAGTERLRITTSSTIFYNTVQRAADYFTGSPSSYTANASYVQTKNTNDLHVLGGWKELGSIITRAYSEYMDIKTNITSDNIMFWFKFMGYNYGYGNTYYFGGGYTYISDVTSKSMGTGQRLLGGAYVYDLYRATSDLALCVKIYLGQTTYTEGRSSVFFYSHDGTTTRDASIVSSVVYNSSSRYF